MGINDFRLRLVGGRFDNRDGTNRQEELARCSVGETVELQREPTNPVDPGAVAVYSCRQVQIGYLKADRAAWMRGKIDAGYEIRASIGRLTGGEGTGFPLGAVLVVNMDGEEPDIC